MAKKRTDQITFTIEGSSVDGGHVRLADFLSELEALKEALRQTERALFAPEPSSVYYRIIDASHSSPLRMVLEAVATRNESRASVRARAVVRTFTSSVREIRRHRRPTSVDLPALESYGEIGATLGKSSVQAISLADDKGKVIPIDSAFKKNVAEVIGPDEYAIGSISGRLEKLNLHNTSKFEIFPTVGAKRIVCYFDPSRLDEVMRGVNRYVTVVGRVRYKQWAKFPHAIDTSSIDVHEMDSDLPALNDLRGIALGATGELSSEDFVRRMRDEDW